MTPNRRDTLILGAGAGLVLVRPAWAQSGAAGPDPRDLTHDPDQPVLGNPDGDVTMVEFIDYRCGYCRKVAAEVDEVVAKDGTGKVDAQVLMRGRITGVEMYADEPYVTIGNSIMPLSTIIALDEKNASVTPPKPDPTPPETDA